MSCNFKLNQTETETSLRSEVGNDNVLFNAIVSEIMDANTNDLSKAFKDYCNETKAETIGKAAVQYYNNHHFDTTKQTKESVFINDVKFLGYSSTKAKTHAVKTAGNLMLSFYHNDYINGILDKHNDDRKNNLANRAITYFKNNIATIICKIQKVQPTAENRARTYVLLNDVNSPAFAKVEKIFDRLSYQYRNQLAAYKDMMLNKGKFFTEVINSDSRLGEIRFKDNDYLDERYSNEYEAEDIENPDNDNTDSANDSNVNNEKDSSTTNWNDGSIRSDFTKNFDFQVRSYLSTIPKLKSAEVENGKYVYDKSNELGMVDYYDFKEINSAIQGDRNVTNLKEFTNQLRNIAKANSYYAGLVWMADDLEKHPDFAYKVFRIYHRSTITKTQSRIEGNQVKTVRSNSKADKVETIKLNFINDIKSSSLTMLKDDADNKLNKIVTKLGAFNTRIKRGTLDVVKLNSNIAELANDISECLKSYFPSLDTQSIINYIRLNQNNGQVDYSTNINNLIVYARGTASAAKDTYETKKRFDKEMAQAKASKDKEKIEAAEQNYINGYVTDSANANAIELAKALAPYSIVNIDANSTNALGNQSADQINDSMITNLLNAVKGTLMMEQADGSKVSKTLYNYGQYKFQGNQYNLSNILLEHKENGQIVNRGLFYIDDNGNYQVTNYARDLINISLFDGAGDQNTGKNVLYSGMSKGDYVYTAYSNYFNGKSEIKGVTMGNYFMRIPSDAPKNFIVTMPKYKIDGLFSNGKVNKDNLNINHPIVKAFRHIFEQELVDMANAINTWFETNTNGQIIYDNSGKPRFKQGWGLDKESARKAYAVYHVGKGHKHFIEKSGNGWSFTGNLFKSDRFVITNYETGKTTNYGQALMKVLFPSLYGGDIAGYIPFSTSNGKIKLQLTDEQNQMIDGMLRGFITDYAKSSVARMNEYKNLDIQGLITPKNVIDFALNNRIAYIAFNDLFEGDTKFYKDTQTFLKRAKEAQASGVPYGFVDDSLDLRQHSTDVQGAYLNSPEIQAKLKNLNLDVQQKTKFDGITIKNTVRTSEECKVAKVYPDGRVEGEDGILVKDLVKNAKLTLEQARDLMGGPILYKPDGTPELNKDKSCRRSGGFSNTTVNDAQSYITYEEWIRRIAGRGQLNEYLPLIEAIADESKPIPASLINKFVQVQKNFYYDQYYDSNTNTIVPRQIKNAEFVLVPRFIKGTSLAKVYDAMKANGIDQLNTEETSKAGKARVLTVFNPKTGECTDELIRRFNNVANAYKEEYDYNHLYTQQETPQHMNAENKAGIQIMKKILDNIDENSPLYDYKKKFTDAYVANIKESYNNILDELKVPRDKNGNIEIDDEGNIKGLDMNVFFKKLKDEVMRLGLDSNMIDYVTLNTESPISINGTPNALMPTYLSNVANKLESISQSVFNNAVTRQTLPGFHAAQITNVGFDKKLQYHPNGERYIEIMLPKSNFGFAKNEDGTYKYTDEELLKQLQDAKLDTIIGYRIPTEGKQSVCAMKVVGFLDDAQGSTIVVPDDWVSQTGSDFDIDSVYGIQYNSTNDENGTIKKIEYDETKTADENNRQQRNNYILDNMLHILQSDDALEENLARSNFDELSAAKKEMMDVRTKAIRNARSPYDFIDQAEYQEDVMSGAKLKAFSVTRDTFCSVCNTVHPKIADGFRVKVNYGTKYDYNTLIKRFGKANVYKNDNNDVIVQHNTIGWTNDNKNVAGFILTAYSSQTTALILDAVKEGCVPNVNDYTFKVFKTFPDVGADYSTAVGFIMQPAITEIVNAYNANKSIYAQDSVEPIKAAIDKVGREILDSLKIEHTDKDSVDDIINKVNGALEVKYSLNSTNGIELNLAALKARLEHPVSRPVERIINHKTYSGLIQPNDNSVFVFGSNPLGINGNPSKGTGGAALVALKQGRVQQGEKIDNIISSNGRAYGLTTVKAPNARNNKANQLSIEEITNNIKKLYEYANKHKDKTFKVAYTDSNLLNGHSIKEIVNAFINAGDIPSNVLFNDSLDKYFVKQNNNTNLDVIKHDWSILFAFNDYAKLSDAIASNARVSNPDRFGAKQTIFATRKVFDDIEELANGNDILTVDGKPFVDAIYAGLVDDKGNINIKNFMASDAESKYPSLNAFLKYASAPSIVVNQMLFDTEQPEFRAVLRELNEAGYRSMNEREYKDYKQYILGSAYHQTDAIQNQYSYDVENKVTKINKEVDKIDESLRIHGYGCSPEFTFEVDSKINPTQEEVDAWSKLSPAQKVYWIKANSADAGIFTYIDTNLYNEYKMNRDGQTPQTIRFTEDSIDSETAYNLFETAYNSENPLIKLAAMDLIKYAFEVEGFKMGRGAINKIIKNSCLRDETSFVQTSGDRTSILDQINYRLPDVLYSENTLTNYIRSTNYLGCKHSYLSPKEKNVGRGTRGMLSFYKNNIAQMHTAFKLGVLSKLEIKEGKATPYSVNYVYINNQPYKIESTSDYVYAYPLNKLEKDENRITSINNANNTVEIASQSYYNSIIDGFRSNRGFTTDELNQIYEESKEDEVKVNNVRRIGYFDPVNDSKNIAGARLFVEQLVEHFKEDASPIIINNLYASSFTNKAKASIAKHVEYDYNNSSIDTNLVFRKASKTDVEKYNSTHGTAIPYQSTLVYVEQPSTNVGAKPENTNMASSRLDITLTTTTDDVSHSIIKELNRRSGLGDIEAGKLTRRLSNEGFTQTIQNYKDFQDSIYYSGYAFLKAKASNISTKFNQFYRDNDGNYHAINSAETIQAIKTDKVLQNDFLETLAEARAIVDKFNIVRNLSADDIEDANTKYYVTEMQKLVNELSTNSIIDDAEVKFGLDYLNKLSNDPNIQNNLIDIFNGFHSSSWFDAWVGDLQEQGNSLVQVVTRKVLADVRAKDAYAKQRVLDFRNHIKDIQAKAKKAGKSINWDNIVDKDGRFIRPYNTKFVDEYNRLTKELGDAKNNIQSNPKAYVEAKHYRDKFLLDHVNREYIKGYYQELYDAEDTLLTNAPQIYAEWTKLNDRVRQINSYRIDGELTPELETELNNVRKNIANLRSSIDEYGVEKPIYDSIPGTETMPDGSIKVVNEEVYNKAMINSQMAAVQLDKYLSTVREIKNKYGSTEEKDGFRDMLDKMLKIVEDAENRDDNGKLGVPVTQLLNNKEYQKAKEWLANNARWEVNDEIKAELEKAYKDLSLDNPRKTGVMKTIKAQIKVLIKSHPDVNFYDEYGNLDGNKVLEYTPDTFLKSIKDRLLSDYKNNNGTAYSDRSLINSAHDSTDICPTEFYKLLNAGGRPNTEYMEKVTAINDINRKYYNSSTKRVETSKMSIEDLKKLKELYDDLDSLKKNVDNKRGYDAFEAYNKFAEVDENTEAYNDEEANAKMRTEPEFYKLWQDVNLRQEPLRGDDGKVVVDEVTGKVVYDKSKGYKINPHLYTTIKPNEEYWNSLSSAERLKQKNEMFNRTKALEVLNNKLDKTNTPQYYAKRSEMLRKGEKEFKQWFEDNHVYNPFTHAYEALPIWTRTKVAENPYNGEYVANWTQMNLSPKEQYKNSNYKEGVSNVENYIQGDKVYDNNSSANEYELELMQYVQDTLNSLAHSESAKRYINQGYLPNQARKADHDSKWAWKQLKEFVGFSDMLPSGKDAWYDKIDYSEDRAIDMPMLHNQLKGKDSINLDDIYKTKPKRVSYNSDEEFNKALEDYQKRINEAKKKNEEVHRNLLDRNFEDAIENFIGQAAHFNAIQDNKQLLFYTSRMLGKLKAYETNLGWNNLRIDSQNSTSDNTEYLAKVDTKLKDQFDNWIRRLVYNQYKIPNNKFTKYASALQSFTSAKFMMLNMTGGIGNVTVGEASIFGEYIAKEYFSPTAWAKGKSMWTLAAPSFLRGMNTETSTSLADAIVKFMEVVDFDEVNNRPTVNLDADGVLKKFRDFMYSPNAMGEHFMQNGAMFSMMFDNRLVPVSEAESNGRLPYEAMTLSQYINKCHTIAMKNIIRGNVELESKFNEFLQSIKDDDNKKKEYIWNRKDITTEFAKGLPKKLRKKFIAERDKLEKEAKSEFEKNPTVMEQLELKDGRLGFKEGSLLDELNKKSNDKDVPDGYLFMGYFKGKVISVNKKIHGVYDKLGAAQLEKQWWGSLMMQYHKHIYPGIMKHYRAKGYFNEERGTREIGCAPALFDFISAPAKDAYHLYEADKDVVASLQTLCKGYLEFAMNLETNWYLMPNWQRASIMRAAGDVIGALGGICLALAIRCLYDDDELKDSTWANFMLYEADELATQSMMYNAAFVPGQADQLWSSPIAGATAAKDIYSAINNIGSYIMNDDYDPTYTTGRYVGQNKIAVKLGRQIPIYRAISNLSTLDKANSYYKTSENILNIVDIKSMAQNIREGEFGSSLEH